MILLTGFEPFGTYKDNPSAEVAEALHGRVVGGVTIRSAVLPVHHARAAVAVAQLVDELSPRAIVHLGLAGGRARLALERVAVNVMDFEIADNAGYRATGEPCVPGGPPAFFSTLPLAGMLEALTANGVPAYLSTTAGTYLCNQTFYTTRHRLESTGRAIPAGFIHLPLSPAMVVAAGLDQPSMDVPLMVRAIEIALRVVTSDGRGRR
ncbi:MAG TPA: pyroglutamyl-peptidase I [Methylomirabilota bacterium]|jgi:pyroglutamyl-peptidase